MNSTREKDSRKRLRRQGLFFQSVILLVYLLRRSSVGASLNNLAEKCKFSIQGALCDLLA
jgi:hypothetical protein